MTCALPASAVPIAAGDQPPPGLVGEVLGVVVFGVVDVAGGAADLLVGAADLLVGVVGATAPYTFTVTAVPTGTAPAAV
jgi:hypothetical protein